MGNQPGGGYTGYTGAVSTASDPFGYPGAETSNNASLPIYTGRILSYNASATTDRYGGEFHTGEHDQVQEHQVMGYNPSPGWGILNPITAFRAATGQPVGQTTVDTRYTETFGGSRPYLGPNPAGGRGTPNFESKSLGEFIASFANYDRKHMQALQKQLIDAGRLNPNSMVYGSFDAATRSAVAELALEVAVQQQATGRPSVTFETQLQNDIIGQKQAIAAGLVANPTPFTGSRTTVDTQITDPTTAQAMITGALANLLGRAPTQAELDQFQRTLAAKESASPVTTVHTFKNGIETGSHSTGGLTQTGANYLAQQQAMSEPDYGDVQAATTYFNALVNAVGAVNSAGT